MQFEFYFFGAMTVIAIVALYWLERPDAPAVIKFKKLRDGATLPKRATLHSGAFDVAVPNSVTVVTGRQVVPLGFAMQLPKNYRAIIKPRSGFASKGIQDKRGARFVCADVLDGVIDADYRGEVGVIIRNEGTPFVLAEGTRIAQMLIDEVPNCRIEEVEELDRTERGTGGFGHTGATY